MEGKVGEDGVQLHNPDGLNWRGLHNTRPVVVGLSDRKMKKCYTYLDKAWKYLSKHSSLWVKPHRERESEHMALPYFFQALAETITLFPVQVLTYLIYWLHILYSHWNVNKHWIASNNCLYCLLVNLHLKNYAHILQRNNLKPHIWYYLTKNCRFSRIV